MNLHFGMAHFKFTETYTILDLQAGYFVESPYEIHDVSKQADEPSVLYSTALIVETGTRFNIERMEAEVFVTLMNSEGVTETFSLTPEMAVETRVNMSRNMFS